MPIDFLAPKPPFAAPRTDLSSEASVDAYYKSHAGLGPVGNNLRLVRARLFATAQRLFPKAESQRHAFDHH